VEAVIQYASTYLTALPLTEKTVAGGSAVVLTFPFGFFVAIALLFVFTFVNLLGVKKFAETNAALVWLKIATPLIAAFALMLVAFETSNLSAADGFAPTGIKGVLTAISAAGVFFAMFGFEQAVQLGGESSNPKRNVPIAVIGSVLIGTVIYILLQIAFLGAVDPPSASRGWENLTFANAAGPFAGLALAVGLGWLAVLLYFDSIISPGGTGLVFTASSSRIVYGLSRNGYIPRLFERVDDRGVPRSAIVLCFLAGCLVFLPFPGWQKLAAFITSAYALVYSVGPVALAALRRQIPDEDRPYRLPAGNILAPAAFIAANFVVYFAGWQTNYKVFIGVALGFVVLVLSYSSRSERRPPLDWRPARWIWPYFVGLGLLSYLGSFRRSQNHPIPLGPGAARGLQPCRLLVLPTRNAASR
jgi:amino acid transporter